MGMRLYELRQERKAALDKADVILTRAESDKREMTPDEVTAHNGRMSEVDAINERLAVLEGTNTLAGIFSNDPDAIFGTPSGAPGASIPGGTPAFGRTSLRAAMNTATPAERNEVRSFAAYIGGDMTALADLRPSGDGGVLIPTLVAGVVARNYGAATPVRNVATVWPTADGDPTRFPVVTDSESSIIIATATATGADELVSGNAPPTSITGPMMGAYKFSSKPVFAPRELLTDASLNVLEELLNALLARNARTQNLKYTKGGGPTVNEPSGFLMDAQAYSAGSVSLNLDVALDLAYDVSALYRPDGVYMASDTTVKYLRKLKTGLAGDHRYLWKAFEEGDATLGTPAKLHGYPLIVNNDMDSVAADGTFTGVSPLAFGAFKRFIVREVESGAPYVYRYAVPALDGSAVIAFSRSDSKLVVPAAIAKLTAS